MEKMTMFEIMNYLGGGAGLGSAIWIILNLKARKKTEQAEADLRTAEADGKVGDNWERYGERLEIKLEQLEKKVDKYTSLYLLEREGRKHAEFFYCKNTTCLDREPVLGTFKNLKYDKANREDS